MKNFDNTLIMAYQIENLSLADWSQQYDGPKFHAVLCDPPYGLSFMGKKWDEQVEAKAWGEALMPHLYPGALVLMFGGTRTWHRLAVGMEDAGFEMWDTMMWLYGQGFPKAQDVSKLMDDSRGLKREVLGQSPNWRESKRNREDEMQSMEVRGENAGLITRAADEVSAPWSGHKTTALKPAWEPILCFKKPLDGTYAECAMKYGSGALNVDGGRIGWPDGKVPEIGTPGWGGPNKTLSVVPTIGGDTVERTPPSSLGRYPANLILDTESAEMLDGQSGNRKAGASVKGDEPSAPTDNCYGEYTRVPFNGFGDSGGASRFFYCAKASTSERNGGLTERNTHPTVKPIALAKYIATLILPPASVGTRRLLVPFAGSGSEMIGALQAGWDYVLGVEQDQEQGYMQIAEKRLASIAVGLKGLQVKP